MKTFCYVGFILFFISCDSKSNKNLKVENREPIKQSKVQHNSIVDKFYASNHQDSIESSSIGSVSNGKLIHPGLLPFSGANFICFDTSSYLNGRTFMHTRVEKTMLETYHELYNLHPHHQFVYMECSNKQGGKIFPHRTHQNGMSVDLMSPLIKKGKPYSDLNTIGTSHYLLEFDDNGKLSNDPEVSIDFELIAEHLLILNAKAELFGLTIDKVIFKMELKNELFQGTFGQRLKNSGIYITRHLEPIINALHDDHYHVDFRKI